VRFMDAWRRVLAASSFKTCHAYYRLITTAFRAAGWN